MSELKIFIEKEIADKPVLIYGLGRSGMSAARALAKAGVSVVVDDDNVDNIDKAKAEGFVILSDDDDLTTYAFLLLSPGIPYTHPEPHDIVKRAQKAALEIICDIELFNRIYKNIKTIGITGTNGKSTTSSLMTHILTDTGHNALLGGNIGTPVFDLKIKKDTEWVVLEMSSFQIDLCTTFRPDVALVLNITPDHIDRHGTMERYVEVKERLVELGAKNENQIAVICTDDSYTKKIYDRAKDLGLRECVQVSTDNAVAGGVYVRDNVLYDALDATDSAQAVEVGDMTKIVSLRGVHNQQNAACAYASLKKVGLSREKIFSAMERFPGLRHRQFMVRTINGVGYVNDSKSTNAASAAVALACQDNVYWIVGGRRKKNGLEGLEDFFSHIKHAFLIGESSEEFSEWFDRFGMDHSRCMTLENALQEAHDMAQQNRGQPGGAGVVLLSPACASFDQFDSFEHRGDVFTSLVEAMEG